MSEPAKKPEKTGICLSGGGIRAAAFGLGALQAIQEKKGLVQGTEGHPETAADYLVAVSGGSYIAGAISMARSRYVPPEDEKLADAIEQDNPGPGHPRVFAPGSDEVEHVRRRAQYLLRGGAGLYEVASQFVVRLLLNLCFVLVPVVVLGMLSALLYRWRLGNLSVQRSPLLHWPMWIALGALVVALAWNIVAVLWPGGRLGKVARTVTCLLLWTAFAAFLAAVVPPLVYWLTPHTHAGTSQATTHSKAGRVAVVATAGSIVTAIAALLSKAQPLVGAIGRFPHAHAFAAKAFRALVIVGAAVLVPLAAVALYVFTVQQTVTVEHAWQALLVVVGLVVLEALLAYMAEPTRWSLHPFYEHRLMSCFCLGWRAKEGLKVSERNPDVQYRWSGWDLPERPELLIAAAANVSTFGSAPAGQNVLPFVLSKHEIGFTNGAFTASTSAEDDTTAARVAPPPTTGGRLDTSALINACRDGKDRLRWRDGKRNLWNLTLPAAVAITGAAFSPLMGKRTIPPVRMLLALFNLRLGVWLPNPQNPEVREAVTAHGAIHRAPHAVHLLREYFGLNSRTSPFIYVSDGGHYENLGLVETLRRGCTTVYCIDASGDPPGQPRTLTEAMRLAAAELSITWDRSCSAALAKLAVTDEPDAAKTKTTKITTPPLVQRTWTRLSFHTADKREGHVIVIKAGLGPETPEHLRSFQRSRPAFPYDGTGNQLFRADRFDAYRELGYSSAMSALAQPIP